MKPYRVITQTLLVAVLLLSACKAKPTPTPVNPVFPANPPDSSQPYSEATAKSVIDGYLKALQNKDWTTAYSYFGYSYTALPCGPYFSDLNTFINIAENTIVKKGQLSSWTYVSVEWKYSEQPGGGHYFADVYLFRNWDSGYSEKDEFLLGDVANNGSGKFLICLFNEQPY